MSDQQRVSGSTRCVPMGGGRQPLVKLEPVTSAGLVVLTRDKLRAFGGRTWRYGRGLGNLRRWLGFPLA